MARPQISWYINVAQTLGIAGGLVLGFKALRLEEAKAGIQHKTIKEVLQEDALRVRNWYSNNFGATKMYKHL